MNASLQFIPWHYTKGLELFMRIWLGYFDVIVHYFSLPLLITTFFAPWKRMIDVETNPGFDIQREFNKLMYNILSRGIGAFVRSGLFLTGVVLIIFTFVSGVLALIAWMVFPPLSIALYDRWLKDPGLYANELLDLMKSSNNPLDVLFDSEAGLEIIKHIGIQKETLLSGVTRQIRLDINNASNFENLMREIVNQDLWRKSFYRKYHFDPQDFVFVASMWDQKRSWQSYIGPPSLGTPSVGLELLFGYTPTLNRYSSDLGSPRSYSHRLIGREDIVTKVERVLASGSSVVLLGEPGVGKRTVLLEFAYRSRVGNLGQEMAYRRVLEFDQNALLAGSVDINQKKSELTKVLTEAAYAGNVILAIRDFHRLTNSQVEGMDFTDVFDVLLEERNLKLIIMSNSEEYERYIAKNIRLRKYLQLVRVEEPTPEAALEILFDTASYYEKQRNIIVTVPALRKILEDSNAYITETPFPEKALELLESVAIYKQKTGNNKVVTIEDVDAVLSEKLGVSIGLLSDEKKHQLTNLEDIIHKELVNQEVAVSLIAKSLRARTIRQIADGRPLGSFLFLGPTGVGKTETARVLAKVYFGTEESILRFDMAEFAGTEGFERLIGSVHENLPGVLTSAIKNRPESLLLLDEFEKTSQKVFNLFLRLLDEGKMTDAFGKTVLGGHLFVIATSNAGAEYIRELTSNGIHGEELQNKVVDYVMRKGIYSPEFLNRFDAVVVYEPLKQEDLLEIARLQLQDLANTLKQRNIYLDITDEACLKLVEDGYDPSFGARPMNRIVRIVLGDLIGRALLDGTIKEDDHIVIVPGSKKEEYTLQVVSG